MNDTLQELRWDFERMTNRSLSMPLAGACVWLIIAACGYVLPENRATVVMLFGTGLIFPIALLIGKVRHENLTDRSNPLPGSWESASLWSIYSGLCISR